MSGLTALLLRNEGILSVLARLYPDEAAARLLLEPLGADTTRLPVAQTGGTRLTWWYDTCRAVEDGAFGFTLETLLAAVREDYPGQAALRRLPATRGGEADEASEAGGLIAFEAPGATFDDIAGYDSVKSELRRTLSLFTHHHLLPASMAAIRHELLPRGLILHGPDGTGKSLFARAVAHAVGATVHAVSGPEMLGRHIGDSERKVREVFAAARAKAPAVLVFDRFDTLVGARPPDAPGSGVVAQFLVELSDWRPGGPVLAVALTTRIGAIPPPLLRAQRFRLLRVDLPGLDDRREIVRHFGRRYEVDLDETVIDLMAHATDGCSGDDVRAVMQETVLDRLSGIDTTPQRLGLLVGRLVQHRRELRHRQP
ncbi:hypothetical protein DI272_32055 [Streptomyces sp. Act143]|uniref:AAA family ATPase n=1 Tax=Streptomyces sp. Act143 TaxID=2200760 RepID=UPI000D676EEB|nr:AAA family ATPase [Streptomyces sp. Act143]PWI18263.1 hypothetical protein DI272_32055 [Streptomyces sp. Act143]